MPDCQIAVFSEYTGLKIRFVRAGTFDDPASVAPDVHIFTRSKLSWVTLPESVPAFDVYYDRHDLWPVASLERLQAAAMGRTAAGVGCIVPEDPLRKELGMAKHLCRTVAAASALVVVALVFGGRRPRLDNRTSART